MKAQNLGFDYTIGNTSHTQKVDVKKVQTENISDIKLICKDLWGFSQLWNTE